jgi:AcrR family transcriptional regulator
MLDKKLDRRIVRTRNLLRDSLLSLIIEKGYEATTVENITDHANLGRATFYLHYRDKTELLLESIDSIAGELITEATKAGFIPGERPVTREPLRVKQQSQAITMVFRYAAKNAELWRIILRGEGMTVASVRIRDILGRIAGNYFDERWRIIAPGEEHIIPTDVLANYFAAALMGFLTWWLETDMKYSAEEMSDMFRKLFFRGAQRAAGLPPVVDENQD